MAKGQDNRGRRSGERYGRHPRRRKTPYTGPNPWVPAEPMFLHRQVDEASAEKINKSTENIDDPRVVRMVDYFTSTLVYPGRVKFYHSKSRAEQRPGNAEIVSALSELALEHASLSEEKSARVVDVGLYGHDRKSVGIEIEYPEYEEEAVAINGVLRELLGYPASYRGFRVGPVDQHISIMRGDLHRKRDLARIEDALPSYIDLGVAQLPVNRNL